jgi:hypothetical protein
MGFAIPNFQPSGIINSARNSINNFTRKHPIIALICAIALVALSISVFSAGSLTGLVTGSIYFSTSFTVMEHIFSNREDFYELIKLSFRSLKSKSYEQRNLIEIQAKEIREKIENR